MFDLSNIEVVCFDYDNTLCIWKYASRDPLDEIKSRSECVREGINYYDSFYKGEPYFYKSKIMDVFIKRYCGGKKVYLCSATKPYATNIKLEWAEKQYKIKFLNGCVEKAEQKVRKLDSICRTYDIKRNQILLVDDNTIDVLEGAFLKGFQTATPTQIAEFLIENHDLTLKER